MRRFLFAAAALFLTAVSLRADIFGNGTATGSSSSNGGGSGVIVNTAAQNTITKYVISGTSNTLGGATELTSDGTTLNTNENINIYNALGALYISNVQDNPSGINLQSTVTSGANFAGGLLGFNLAWNVALSSYIVSNDFGTDYFGMMIRRGGDVAFSGSNQVASNTFLTDAQVMANNYLYIKGTTGLLGVNMGGTVPSTAGFQVKSSTTVAYSAYFSTTTAGGFGVDISTTGHFNIFNSSSTQGPTITNATTRTSKCSDASCSLNATTSPAGFVFAKPYATEPACNVTERNGSVTNAMNYVVTTSSITITQTSLNSIVDIHCFGGD